MAPAQLALGFVVPGGDAAELLEPRKKFRPSVARLNQKSPITLLCGAPLAVSMPV